MNRPSDTPLDSFAIAFRVAICPTTAATVVMKAARMVVLKKVFSKPAVEGDRKPLVDEILFPYRGWVIAARSHTPFMKAE